MKLYNSALEAHSKYLRINVPAFACNCFYTAAQSAWQRSSSGFASTSCLIRNP
ncbi:hypothetical protein SNOG_03211 [Parastagonospora nodorum SN15]|uniref:Uncharacterized protein n=1 Tax=Phaeosphaeria nodorum (strain SN15 / ATCC MYA-4574 / FGSC 10173) TaxID=321614 RepID=Q0UYF3_PHANO|nr:hypothetical protein SNOG_03211 [Parastagonospora nodorum SN15]EAT89942.1 hypothetical protein SNOG_03211 [Parastagonospora nodorum SN15]